MPKTSKGEQGPKERLRRAGSAGHFGQEDLARRAFSDETPRVRAAGLGALAKMGKLEADDLIVGLFDGSEIVRRRSAETSVAISATEVDKAQKRSLEEALIHGLDDSDPLFVEAAVWALGEKKATHALARIHDIAANHPDMRCREAGIAALGNIGDPTSLSVLLLALLDKPSVRRRAAVALAAFEGPEAEEGLTRCLTDRDWQVREIAEILLDRGDDG